VNTSANRLRVVIFQGHALDVAINVNNWLEAQPAGVRVVSIKYAYVGMADQDNRYLQDSEHGVLISYTEGDDAAL
jgi:hypothetical protein